MAEYSDYSILIIKKGQLTAPKTIIPLNEFLEFHSDQSVVSGDNISERGYIFIPDLLPGDYIISLNALEGNSAYRYKSEINISANLNTITKNSTTYVNLSITSSGEVRFNLSTNYILQNVIIMVHTVNMSLNMFLEQARIIQVIG